MNFLLSDGLTRFYGEKILFKDISLSVNKGQKIALIARNGTGKSTLLRILAGLDTADSGKVERHPAITIGYLPQEPEFPAGASVSEAIFQSGIPKLDLIRDYENCVLRLNIHNRAEDKKLLDELIIKMDHLQAWDIEARVKEILSRFRITDLTQNVDSLSGGQQKRVALAAILILDPDIFILDEPTNHLDVEMIEWLEKHLSKSTSTALMVTHDRYFLDNVTNEIIEIADGQSYKYKGNYSYFMEKKAEREYNKIQEIDKAKSILRTEREWMRRQPQARTTKAQARIDSYYELEKTAAQQVKQDDVQMQMKEERLGGKILLCKSVTKIFQEKIILDKFTYTFNPKDRIGIIGPNGCGKSTMLRLFTGEEMPDTGSVKAGDTVKFGYYKQDGLRFEEDKKVIDIVRDIAEYVQLSNGIKLTAIQLLNHFLFANHTHYQFVHTLSGGEKRRLYILTILMHNPNFFILDEPTNDLDLQTLKILEDFLIEYKGVLVVVSHDRYFLDKLVDHIFVFEGDGIIKDYPGTYLQYREWLKTQNQAEKAENPIDLKSANDYQNKEDRHKNKLSFKEKRELEELEKNITTLEAQKGEVENHLASGVGNSQEIMQWSHRLSEILVNIDTQTNRWMELSEKKS